MPEFLCLVIDRVTKKELDSFKVKAIDYYYARRQAVSEFENKLKYNPTLRKEVNDWYVDSCEL